MAAVIANEFTEAADNLYLSALIEIGLVLFVITLIINVLSRLLIWSVRRDVRVQKTKVPGAASAAKAAA
jgi:phosphate transport system permease protein